ncbi:hypothetical protein PIB30_047975 [Stylosanthes scabra]|uniref:Uncharacterized protein n=1 Tax=Stylosanthes scabra TaxID=79078 RepID=A0ABU6RGZ2_9FABA|nr:hypothetical protein [Stylosanthes scabra]
MQVDTTEDQRAGEDHAAYGLPKRQRFEGTSFQSFGMRFLLGVRPHQQWRLLPQVFQGRPFKEQVQQLLKKN